MWQRMAPFMVVCARVLVIIIVITDICISDLCGKFDVICLEHNRPIVVWDTHIICFSHGLGFQSGLKQTHRKQHTSCAKVVQVWQVRIKTAMHFGLIHRHHSTRVT